MHKWLHGEHEGNETDKKTNIIRYSDSRHLVMEDDVGESGLTRSEGRWDLEKHSHRRSLTVLEYFDQLYQHILTALQMTCVFLQDISCCFLQMSNLKLVVAQGLYHCALLSSVYELFGWTTFKDFLFFDIIFCCFVSSSWLKNLLNM